MKKVLAFIGIIILIFTMFEIIDSYAKYTSEGSANVQKEAGAWVIEVNDSDISDSSLNDDFVIDSLTYPGNSYVLANKIAPGTSGYFEIVIDATGTSVAVRIDVTIDFTELDISDAINFDSAVILGDNNTTTNMVRTGEYTYTGILSLADIEDEEEITTRYFIRWDEDLTGTNDEDDSRLGVLREESSLNLPVSVVVSQYCGETLTEYEDE